MCRSQFKINGLFLLLAVSAGLFLSSCAVDRRMSRKVNGLFKESEVLKKHYVGFALYDMSTEKMVFENNADKYFTPASNTKLFTFYGGLKITPDSIPALRYIERGDSLIFWGTGDPSFLYAKFKGTRAFDFLKTTNKQLYFAPGRYSGDFYGKGWQWDDYNDYYQSEINEFPIMGNLLEAKENKGALTVSPQLFADCVTPDSSSKEASFLIKRDFNTNRFNYPAIKVPEGYTQEVPYKVSLSTTLALLSDTLNKEVGLIRMKMPTNAKTVYSLKADSVFKEMMVPSDNFIAEQLLLVYCNQIGEGLSAEKAIQYIKENYLNGLQDKPVWVDGSGLSRYNLVTPRDIITLLELIYKEVNDQKRLFAMLPAGGKSGTLKNAYPKTNEPFVFGKTGTLSNIHCQSGYVVTKKNRVYLFSFMNNNFVSSTTAVRDEMGKIITYIHENY
ncbi:D-alanyl-D-alanine carboxypeptidase/D-alanyl-D-alanine-endopeptidase [Pedobacter foliorum]|uniref:D-alanyl-D-alanine carboxypeptidase/D-alanyl-D-alanine-endopeptidase n=1 Tax=Pedobacter foliorum TaxID=2739058 RepID=UPI0015665426|nr:D-alanyl-D-alanine carboxypeptidase [Pedobacter foliorum]NRF38436.1 D-alanyl-D-alanine carboxypeptidase [Pedobacter foliorum]